MAALGRSVSFMTGLMLGRAFSVSAVPASTPKKVLIVSSHPNVGKSYSHILIEAAKSALESDGHEVIISDLVESNFNPVGGPQDFLKLQREDFFDYQGEQKHAVLSEDPEAGFAPELQREMDRFNWCDVVIHHFPIYWWSMPALHKGWIDRVLAYYWCYGGGIKRLAGKDWMIAVTTGGPSKVQLTGGWPAEGTDSVVNMMQNINMATPAMLGMNRLPLFLAGGPGAVGEEGRAAMIQEYVAHVRCYVGGTLKPEEVPEPVFSRSVHEWQHIKSGSYGTAPPTAGAEL